MSNPADKTTRTPSECVQSCLENAQQAGREAARSRQLFQALPPGDARLPSMRADFSRFRADEAHWRELAAFWRGRGGEPEPAEPDRRLPREREIGDDDEELAF